MQYRQDHHGNSLSMLGYGCMRFPKKHNAIDMEQTEQLLLAAVEQGVNYFDTAYIYPGSEEALGTILAKHNLRDKVNIATKLPHYMIKKPGDIQRYFDEQLRRLKTDHIDYYLMHMLPECTTWNRLKALGIEDFLNQKRAEGAIRHVGFSYHGNTNTFCELIDAYNWEFCQIQYNYIDENTQAGKRGLQYAASKGIPVVIMEPLRGGRLVNLLPEAAVKRFADATPKRTPAEWGLRWLWNQPEVTVILSGMNGMDMLLENCRIASEAQVGELTEQDFQMYADVIQSINSKIKVGCTGCGYCMPCPQGVDIPGCFRAYNERYSEGFYTGMKEYFMCTTLRKRRSNASNCIKCGKCEKHCPQGISIRNELVNVKKVMEGPVYQLVKAGATLLGRF